MRPKLLHSLHTFSIIWGAGFSIIRAAPVEMQCTCCDVLPMAAPWTAGVHIFLLQFFLETHVHKTAFWTVRNYDDHCTVVVAICGQSQNVPKMVLIIAWACDWFFHCRMPLIAWVRLPPRARPDCREGSRHCLRIFGLGCLIQCC